MDSLTTSTTSPPRPRGGAEDALRVALEENARLRAECEALRERQAKREIEFRQELRQLAAQCASLAASAAVTTSASAAVTTTSATAASSSGIAEANAASGDRRGSASAPAARTAKPPTAWEVPNAWPRTRKGTSESASASARARALAIEVEDAATRAREERSRDARRSGRERKNAEAFAGDLSSFFFKTAKHDAPVWQTKRERNDAFARELLRASTASDEHLLDDDDDDARPAVESDAFDWNAPASTVEDETEADLADSLRDDEDLVSALLRGGMDGERAAEILASRLRAVGFVEDEISP